MARTHKLKKEQDAPLRKAENKESCEASCARDLIFYAKLVDYMRVADLDMVKALASRSKALDFALGMYPQSDRVRGPRDFSEKSRDPRTGSTATVKRKERRRRARQSAHDKRSDEGMPGAHVEEEPARYFSPRPSEDDNVMDCSEEHVTDQNVAGTKASINPADSRDAYTENILPTTRYANYADALKRPGGDYEEQVKIVPKTTRSPKKTGFKVTSKGNRSGFKSRLTEGVWNSTGASSFDEEFG